MNITDRDQTLQMVSHPKLSRDKVKCNPYSWKIKIQWSYKVIKNMPFNEKQTYSQEVILKSFNIWWFSCPNTNKSIIYTYLKNFILIFFCNKSNELLLSNRKCSNRFENQILSKFSKYVFSQRAIKRRN